MSDSALFAKYDVPVPRYTSYPTVPHWAKTPTLAEWADSLNRALAAPDASIAIYVHLPFCESLCTYCGCNTVITKDHGRAAPYIDLVLAELDRYLAIAPGLAGRPIGQVHLGGGTPTFMAPETLGHMLQGISDRLPLREGAFEGSIEVDPRVTTTAHLETLRAHDITRISLGVQDVDPDVQDLVNRHQPVDMTERLCTAARALGYESINFDLIYGLPGQTEASMKRLGDEVVRLAPDRLAVYSFARVPWIKPQQRKFKDDQIPSGAEKRALYETIRTPLDEAGYIEIGLDHFARPNDGLARSAAAGTLHRNFMGYAERKTTIMIGLGVSAISETPDCYHQNDKIITVYDRRVRKNELPTFRGHCLTKDDEKQRATIWRIMTTFHTTLDREELDAAAESLQPLIDDGLVAVDGLELHVLPAGRPFLRNIAACFDAYVQHKPTSGPLYSTSA
jgi:oxygen-independent coproporphyrinogen-3 oxidase